MRERALKDKGREGDKQFALPISSGGGAGGGGESESRKKNVREREREKWDIF